MSMHFILCKKKMYVDLAMLADYSSNDVSTIPNSYYDSAHRCVNRDLVKVAGQDTLYPFL